MSGEFCRKKKYHSVSPKKRCFTSQNGTSPRPVTVLSMKTRDMLRGCLSIDRPVYLSLNPRTAHFPQSFLKEFNLPWTDCTCLSQIIACVAIQNHLQGLPNSRFSYLYSGSHYHSEIIDSWYNVHARLNRLRYNLQVKKLLWELKNSKVYRPKCTGIYCK